MNSQNTQDDIEQYKRRIQDLEKEVDVYKSWHRIHRSMAHELRTHLSPIIGYSRLLQEKTVLNETQSNYINILLNHGAYPLLHRINNYSDFNKLVLGEMEIETGIVDIRSKLNDMIKELSLKTAEKGVVINCEVDQEVPELIKSDRSRIGQIFQELIDNAIRFTTKGQIIVSLEDSSSVLHFKVRDTGTGISSEDLERLKYLFKREFSKLDLPYGGLGLLIVKMLCDLLKGNVWVESQAGVGSTFHVTIPYEKST